MEEKERMVLSEDEAVELITFLITSARTQLDDPCHYASMRLLTAVEILRDFMIKRVSPNTQKLLTATIEKTNHAQIYLNDVETFTDTLDELCRMTAQYLVDESELEAVS